MVRLHLTIQVGANQPLEASASLAKEADDQFQISFKYSKAIFVPAFKPPPHISYEYDIKD